MAHKGNHDIYVNQMVDDYNAHFKSIEGLDEHPHTSTVSDISIKNFNDWADPWNPLFSNDEYAKGTKYGRKMAFPMYEGTIVTALYFPHLPPEGGYMSHHFVGENWSNLHPVYSGDHFTVMRHKIEMEDITIDGEDTVPQFISSITNADIINQDNQITGTLDMVIDVSVLPKLIPADPLSYEDHYYTQEELDYIQDVIAHEEIRGATPRYWEDVQPGEELPACTLGPITRWDAVAFTAARQEQFFHPTRYFLEYSTATTMTDEFNIRHLEEEWHISNTAAQLLGDPRSFNYGESSRTQMARIVTNWMGDDGELRNFNWRHLKKTYLGECLIARGRVVGKRINEDGEHVVDIDVWLDNPVRGNVSEFALATAVLPVKNPDDPALASMTFDNIPKRTLKYGDRVRIKERTDLFPTGNPLAGAEGVVGESYPWQRSHYNDDGDYVSVLIDKCDFHLSTGNDLFIKEENLEKIG